MDQPRWARPALLGLTVMAGFLYAWNATGNLEIYYAAAVRSMSMSWHNFVFASFDPAGHDHHRQASRGVLGPGAVGARVRLARLGASSLPQVVEGVASVLVLYRVGPPPVRAAGRDRRRGGARGCRPATVLLNRGNIPDTLMVLLLVLAADATVSAIVTGRLRQPDRGRRPGRPGLPGQDDRGLAGPARRSRSPIS